MSRRAVHVICGVAVLFAGVLYAQVFHHVFIAERHEWNGVVVAGAIVSDAAGVFCFIGAYLLPIGGRGQR